MNSTDTYTGWYEAMTTLNADTSSIKKDRIYAKEDFLKKFCGDMSMETLQQILREHAPEHLI